MKRSALLAVIGAGSIGVGSGYAVAANSSAKPCNGQKPCVTMHLNSAYNAAAAKLLCLYQPDIDNKPQLFCGPPQAKAAVYVSITPTTIEIDRAGGSKVKTLYSVHR